MQWIVNRLRGSCGWWPGALPGAPDERVRPEWDLLLGPGVAGWAHPVHDGAAGGPEAAVEAGGAGGLHCGDGGGAEACPPFWPASAPGMPFWRGSHCPWQRCASCPASCSPSR